MPYSFLFYEMPSLQDDSAPLTWEMRMSISIGLIRAVEYLHNFGILHGNIKR